MKTYFAKYLPVEGEIKKRMKYRIGKSLGLGAYTKGYTGTAAIDFTPDAQRDQQATILKLFLCSKDIEINDKILFLEDNTYMSTDTELELKQHKLLVKLGKAAKVIGEISPEALSYVKEGDEFDEDEIVPIYWNNERKQGLAWYAIKGPCGYFH